MSVFKILVAVLVGCSSLALAPSAFAADAAPLIVGEPPAPTPTPAPVPTLSSRFQGDVVPNLQTGRYMTSGSIGLTSDSNSGWNLRLNPQIEYFVSDVWSVGGKISASIQNGYNSGGFGPSASYHYWKQDRLDAYVGADLLYYRSSQLSSSRRRVYTDAWTKIEAAAGLNYFVTPSVAFGPELIIGHIFSSGGANLDSQSLLAHFAIFL